MIIPFPGIWKERKNLKKRSYFFCRSRGFNSSLSTCQFRRDCIKIQDIFFEKPAALAPGQ